MMAIRSIIVFIFCCLSALPLLAQQFEEAAIGLGIDHVHTINDLDIGGGAVIFDFNNDGWEDIYLTSGMGIDHLYQNNQGEDFELVSEEMGLAVTRDFVTIGAVAGDINNDGWKDLLVTAKYQLPDTISYTHNLLFLNQEGNGFQDITEGAGLNQVSEYSTSAAMGDINLDGYVDIYVVNYTAEPTFEVFNHETGRLKNSFDFEGGVNELYVNQGDLTFENVTETYGLGDFGCGLAVTFTDIDRDARPDVYIANDFGYQIMPNTLYLNRFPEPFSEEAVLREVDARIHAMGIATGDFNRDGYLDHYVTNIGANYLYKSLGDTTFAEVSLLHNVQNLIAGSNESVGWGCNFLDVQNNGYLDLFVVNGGLSSEQSENLNALYLNDGAAQYTDIAENAGLADPHLGRGSAVGDLNNDGLLDIVVVNQAYQLHFGDWGRGKDPHSRVYLNRSVSEGNFISLALEGVSSNRDGMGAQVKIYAEAEQWIQEVNGGSSHLSQNSTRVHVGIGSQQPDSLVVIWPGGKRQVMYEPETNQLLRIRECDENDKGCGYIQLDQVTQQQRANPAARVFPTPAVEDIFIQFQGKSMGKAKLVFYDAAGKRVYQKEISTVAGNNSVQIGRSEIPLPPGVFPVKVRVDGRVEMLKVVLR